MHNLLLSIAVLTGLGDLAGRRPPQGALLRQPHGVGQRRRPTTQAGGPLGRRAPVRRAEQGVFDVTITQDGAEVDPREARPLQGRRLLHGDQSARAWTRTGSSPGSAAAAAFVGHPFHGQHLPGLSRVRRDARRRLRPASLADQGESADEGPGQGRGPDAPGDAAPGESFEIADDIYQFKNFDRGKVAVAAAAWTPRASTWRTRR